jgi:hypothetical protein
MRLMRYVSVSSATAFLHVEIYIALGPKRNTSDIGSFWVTQLDDALSATRLPDGRIKVWIHVADPTCLVKPRSIMDRLLPHLLFC